MKRLLNPIIDTYWLHEAHRMANINLQAFKVFAGVSSSKIDWFFYGEKALSKMLQITNKLHSIAIPSVIKHLLLAVDVNGIYFRHM